MAVSAGMARVTLNEDGSFDLVFADSTGQSFADLAALTAYGDDSEDQRAKDLVMKLLVKWWLLRDASGLSPGIVVGKTITLDPTQPLMLEVA